MSSTIINQPAPAFSMEVLNVDGTFSTVTNETHKGKWLVLAAYPLVRHHSITGLSSRL